MSGPPATTLELIRPEVIEARRQARAVVADPLARSHGPIAVALLVLAAIGVVWASHTITVDHSTSGHAVVSDDGRSALGTLPVGAAAALRPGQRAALRVGGRDVGATVASVRGVLAEGDGLRDAVVGVRLDIDRDSAASVEGADTVPLTVRLDRLTLWDTFAPSRLFRAVRNG